MKGLHIFDAEADGLLDEMTHFHCILFKEYKVNNWNLFLDPDHEEYESAVKFANSHNGANLKIHDFKDFAEWITNNPTAVACHNSFGYDFPAFQKFLGIEYDLFGNKGCTGTINGKDVSLWDTLSMSRILYPDRPLPRGCPTSVKCPVTGKARLVGPHGLLAWGYRVANKKVEIEDWRDQPLWTYVDRVWEDVIINERVWEALILEMNSKMKPEELCFYYKEKPGEDKPGRELDSMKQINWKHAMRRGMIADYLMQEQEFQGVQFDLEKAIILRDDSDKMMKEIEDEYEPQLPMKEITKSKQPTFPAKPFKEGDGSISTHGWNWLIRLGYPVDEQALKFKGPPKKCFDGNGELTKTAIKYCIDNGHEDESTMADFIREKQKYEQEAVVLPDELMAQARQDLLDKKMPDMMEPMKLSNQADIKKFLIKEGGWRPTLWGTKDVTKDAFKKQRSDGEVDQLVNEYIDWLDASEYRHLILHYLGKTEREFRMRDKFFKFIRRKARQLPTSPKIKDERGELCPDLERLDADLAKAIVKWLSLRNRRSTLDPMDEDKTDTGWINHPRLKIDGKLPARYTGITNTGRRKHTVVANVPKPDEKVLLGKRMRELYTVPEGKYQCGIDGSNLEGMIAAWGAYAFDGGEYLRIMESGDAHSRNAEAYSKAAGVTVTRNGGKGITYGIMYGAQAAKISAMLGISLEKAQQVIDAFWDSNFGLKGRREWLERFWEANGRKFIPGLDGRKIYTRSKHSLLNAYQQNGGAALFDLVGNLFHLEIKKRGWYDQGVRRTIYYHKHNCGFTGQPVSNNSFN